MAYFPMLPLTCIAVLCGLIEAQHLGRPVYTYMPTRPSETTPCANPGEDFNQLLLLSKLLENDCDSASHKDNYHNVINVGEIIDKLVNALVFTTAQRGGSGYSGGHGGFTGHDGYGGHGWSGGHGFGDHGWSGDRGAPGSGGHRWPGSSNGGHGGSGSRSGNKGNDEGLVDLSLLDSNDLVKLMLSGLDILRVGVGSDNNKSNNKNKDEGLIDLSLLDHNDLLKLMLGGQDILRLGVGSDKSKGSNTASGAGNVVGGLLEGVGGSVGKGASDGNLVGTVGDTVKGLLSSNGNGSIL
ncbi:uncharacterized PE-PGRS family protein PE_PGRS36-like [Achroia grisella]|uniref:uncharacterized PE-PGRS family protein PE_PGRS36-like n=1 Tax=Achroia grisella TaxID=688607 RepID=UPI0027D31C39|nr:uncharacterized PE-PGRS family protein PE_PGRS36-like [Achroia grisella]